MGAIAGVILVLALAGILLRPRGIPEWAFAAAGALAMVATTAESPGALWHVVRANDSVIAFLAGVLVLAAAAEEAGWFAEGARLAVRASGGSSRRLFAGVCVVSFLGSAIFSLDAAAVALTPVVLLAARRCGAALEPPLFACIAVANTASLALPVSNPTNVVVADRLHLGFGAYATAMVPAALAASAAVSLVLFLRFRAALARPLTAAAGERALGARLVAVTSALGSAAALAGFAIWPHDLGTVALAGGGAAALVLLASRHWSAGRAARATGPRLLVFALGVFAMVDAAERHGLRAFVLRHDPASATGLGVVAGALSNVVNNLPATAITLPLAGTDPARAHALLAGVDAAPNLTLAGSLATLLWIAAARGQGVDVRPLRYVAIGVLTAPVGLAAALGVLAVTA